MYYESINNVRNDSRRTESEDSRFEASLEFNENELEWQWQLDDIDKYEEKTIKIFKKEIIVSARTFEMFKVMKAVSKPFLVLTVLLIIIFFMSRTELFLPANKNG